MARVWVFNNNISTDDIIAGRYMPKFEATHDSTWLASHVMENIDSSFASKVAKGDVIIAGRNFGCGSSREEAPIALKAAGISAVVAESFARIFYRNSINRGLTVLTCPGVHEGFKSGDTAKVDFQEGVVRNLKTGKVFKADLLPNFVLKIIQAGGLLPHLKQTLKR
ncbi:MAG: 3-isopropylmalate dehydratase small subunit [Hadesarchaea archaeon]|nr:3-isopropylmalate dehydratase small subunit [Hadesarchaea archaeon]MDH5685147.1 3-isopropylmalate dehydratase small subunit [Hadesarchaea archaeon]